MRVSANLQVMSIAFLLPNNTEAVIWRGPKKTCKQCAGLIISPLFIVLSCTASCLYRLYDFGEPHAIYSHDQAICGASLLGRLGLSSYRHTTRCACVHLTALHFITETPLVSKNYQNYFLTYLSLLCLEIFILVDLFRDI